MALSAGTRFGSYEIVALIGAGGMGEVYRARDTKLKRDVALKVLPEAFADDPERMARFQREAEVLASLNHPNIAHIYGVEERALVMELVEGESPKGPLPLEDARKIAAQIAEALEYAHEKGVIHRDLKPANVKVTPEGTVKLLDFGLAKAIEDPIRASEDPSNSPTLTLGATRVGMIMGTAAYMAPEQASGKPADRRADIWSFGAVFYELLTGKKAFDGDSVSDTLASVLKLEPDWSALPAATPASIKTLIRRCLTKDRKQRLQAIGEARITLEAPPEPAAIVQAAPPRHARLPWTIAAVAAIALAAASAVAWRHLREEPPPAASLFFSPPDQGTFEPNHFPALAVSPDGRRIAYEAVVDGKSALWVRDLDNSAPRKLAEIPGLPGVPFWAPDSRRLGFFANGQLKKIDVTGGPAVTIAPKPGGSPASGSWNQDDVIVFSELNTPLFRVSAGGGSPTRITELDSAHGEGGHMMPWFLPDGRHFLYLAGSVDLDKGGVYIGDLSSKARKRLMIGKTRTIYVNPGYLVFVRDRTLMAQPFDARKLEITGDAVPLAEQIDVQNSLLSTLGFFSASQNGLLTYTAGGAGAGNIQLTWFDRTGKRLDSVGAPGNLTAFSLSPDGNTVVLTRRDPQTGRTDLWTRDLVHGSESRLTVGGDNMFPAWSADGTQIFFYSNREGVYKVYQKAANGTGSDVLVDPSGKLPMDASRDGRYLITETAASSAKTGNDIWVQPLFGDRKPFPYVATEFRDGRPRLSPDGRWLAYESNASQRMEIYVVSFPNPGGKWQISNNGGRDAVWSHDGHELYYYSLDNQIMAVDIKPGAQFQFSVPKPLFEVRMSVNNVSFAVSNDGRFLLPALLDQGVSAPMTVVLNWPELLKKK